MITLKYDGFLTEAKLVDLFKQIQVHCPDMTIETQYKIPGTRYRGDIVVTTPLNKYLIEFDGFYHFTNAKTIVRDEDKDIAWYNLYGTAPVRIPYFLQVGGATFSSYFSLILPELTNKKIHVDNTYISGFIDAKACLPADFCSLGIVSFERYLDRLRAAPLDSAPYGELIHIIYSLAFYVFIKKTNEYIVVYPNLLIKYKSQLMEVFYDVYQEDFIKSVKQFEDYL